MSRYDPSRLTFSCVTLLRTRRRPTRKCRLHLFYVRLLRTKIIPSLPFLFLSIRIHTVVCNHLRGNEYMWTTVRDYGIVRTTPWNETSSRERNNNIRVSILFSFSFLFFFLLFCYLLRISRLKKREKERNGKRETIDENFSIHRDNREL